MKKIESLRKKVRIQKGTKWKFRTEKYNKQNKTQWMSLTPEWKRQRKES